MKKVLLLLADGFEAYEASVFTDVLGWANEFGDEPIMVSTAGKKDNLKCTWNLTVVSQMRVRDVNVEEFDALAVPGGFGKAGFYDDVLSGDFLELIKAFNSADKTIASICVGAIPLAKSGILINRRATTYHLSEGRWRKQLKEMGAIVVDEAIVQDKNIITSTSPATAPDVAFLLLETLTSKKNTNHIKKLMGW